SSKIKSGNRHDIRAGSALPERVPVVIEDAIKVTLALGFQFFWVDKYCIDQENQATKHKQIFHMDAVYRHACLSIIAAAGADQSTGLPVVTQDRPARQASIQTDEVSILSKLPSPVSQIANSKWASRAWTFQDAILSHRQLVFTDDQLYFECDSMHCYESLFFGVGHQTAGILTYAHCADEYTRRSLTFDEDCLNAFTGVTRNLEKTRKPPEAGLYLLVVGWMGRVGSLAGQAHKRKYAAILNEGTAAGLGAVRLQLEDGSVAQILELHVDFRTEDQAYRRPRALFLATVALPRDALVFEQDSDVLRS
ncbi:hypothetical protein DHEL01_v206829, partial [Diaporthe helianthi]